MSELFRPSVPNRRPEYLKGSLTRANRALVWLPDSVVEEEIGAQGLLFNGVDRIRPYYRYGNELIEVSFKSVVYPAIDPEQTDNRFWPRTIHDSRLSADGQKLNY